MKTDEVAQSLQFQKDVPLWAIADIATVMAISSCKPRKYGPRGKLIRFIFLRLKFSFLGLQAMRIIGLGVLIVCSLKARFPYQKGTNIVEELFVGHGAGSEPRLWEKFCEEGIRRIVHLNQTDPSSFGIVYRPGFKSIISMINELFILSKNIFSNLNHSKNELLFNNRIDFLICSAMRIGFYVFYKHWFAKISDTVKRVVFISPDIAAWAANDARENPLSFIIEYWQHGFLVKGLILPKFDRAIVLTEEEATFLRTRKLCNNINLFTYSKKRLDTYSKRLLFISHYDIAEFRKKEHLDLYKRFFDWSNRSGFDIIIRPHPSNVSADVRFWNKYFPQLHVDVSKEILSSSFIKWTPLFLVTRASTSLLDALQYGILAISLFKEMKDFQAIYNMVFNIQQAMLFWPKEKNLIEYISENKTEYQKILQEKIKFSFGIH